MKKKLVAIILASTVLVSGCSFFGNSESRDEGKKNVESVDVSGTLKDINLPAKGIILSGYNNDMKLSPDGKLVAFSGYDYDHTNGVFTSQYVLADLVKGNVSAYTNINNILEWSPDSSAFTYIYDGKLNLFDTKTAKAKEIAKDCWNGSVSPDGSQIAYSQKEKGLWVYNIKTGEGKQLTKSKYEWYPIWYPDGKHIFYFRDLGTELGDGAGHLEGMAKISVETGEIEDLSSKTGKFRCAEWIVPGESLYIYEGWDDAYNPSIFDLAAGKYVNLGEYYGSPEQFISVDSKNGRLIKSSMGLVEIYDAHGVKISSYSLPEKDMQNFNYTVSPGGEKLAFVHGEFGRHMDSKIKGNIVKVSDYNGQNVQVLTSDNKYFDTIMWDKAGKNVIALQLEQIDNKEMISYIKVLPVNGN